MNVRYPMGVFISFSIKNIFYDKMDLRLFYFHVTISIFSYTYSEAHSELSQTSKTEPCAKIVNGFQQLTGISAFNYFRKKLHRRCLIDF